MCGFKPIMWESRFTTASSPLPHKLFDAMVLTRPVYFGYGSNMWLDQMARRCPESKYLGVGLIKDWKWIICERGFANVKRSPGDILYGLIYELSETDEKNLDGYEHVPVYYLKKYHTITFLGTTSSPEKSETKALFYINGEWLKESPPNPEYIYRMNMAIADGIKAGIPEDYMEKYLRPFIPREYEVPEGK
ncbi:hypothetical protein D9756_008795 [Leucocoprinus leucothites]|uniref:gamma-glutamylcyclotransferase n=1 Tax=Leucocoprinus leucothites TaxID=201217 RepID=A0A8H5CXA8_9AGAR|nr:hypothetical protein D9756_008795 [Leucoagaricus leucothites]